jgi:hypothetical protein
MQAIGPPFRARSPRSRIAGWGALVSLALSCPAIGQNIQLDSAEPTYGAFPEAIQLTGSFNLNFASVTIDGAPAPVLSLSSTAIVVDPPPSEPGLQGILIEGFVSGGGFEIQFYPEALKRWPLLTASAAPIGSTLQVNVEAGGPGTCILASSPGTLATPLSFAGVGHGLTLDAASGLTILGVQPQDSAGEVTFDLPIPLDIGLVGATPELQALATAGAAPGAPLHFSNCVPVVIEDPFGGQAPSGLSYEGNFVTLTQGSPVDLLPDLAVPAAAFSSAPPLDQLVAGLTFDPATGAIGGSPEVVGTFQAQVTADNPYGTTSATVTFDILPEPKIVACSLGCSGIDDLVCTQSTIVQDEIIEVTFNQPMDPASISSETVRIVDLSTGQTVPGEIALVGDGSVLRFTPVVVEQDPLVLSFEPGGVYLISIPKAADAVPSLVTTNGAPLANKFDCVVNCNGGFDLPSAGVPQATLQVLPTNPLSPNIVSKGSEIALLWDTLILPASALGGAGLPGVQVQLIVQGGDGSQVSQELNLSQDLTLDLEADTSRMRILPPGQWPVNFAGDTTFSSLEVVLPPSLQNVDGDLLGVPQVFPLDFETEVAGGPGGQLPEGGEDFFDLANIDAFRTGAEIDTSLGLAQAGPLGGSGYLGDLIVRDGEVVTLTADDLQGTLFGAGTGLETGAIDNYDPLQGAGTQPVQVLGGLFDFASLIVEPGGRLEIDGDLAARLRVRGEARIQGVLDASGKSPGEHNSTEGFGQPGGTGGPGGFAGGRGADRPDSSGTELIGFPGLFGFEHQPGAQISIDGALGDGVGGGGGGSHWPLVLPGPLKTDLGGFESDTLCNSNQVGAPGAGATRASLGTAGSYIAPGAPQPLPPPLADVTPQLWTVSQSGLDAGLLLGGGGGGGGGAGIQGTKTNGSFITQCQTPIIPGLLEVLVYQDHSAAGGGGGGGALELQTGAKLDLEGSIAVRGGDGGAAISGEGLTAEAARAAPGGGGAGGALLLRLGDLQTGPLAKLDLRGGDGGASIATGAQPSIGGAGGPGVLRLELANAQLPLGELFSLVLPETGGLDQPQLTDLAQSTAVSDQLADQASGLQSCWLRPGDFPDGVSLPNGLTALDWDMVVRFSDGSSQSWRGASQAQSLVGTSWADFFGNELGSSPLVVRFQGARFIGELEDPCTEVLEDTPELIPGSVTPWLRNAEEVLQYFEGPAFSDAEANLFKSNAVRYQILIDPNAPNAQLIEAVERIEISYSLH